jgi:hypothetical protein
MRSVMAKEELGPLYKPMAKGRDHKVVRAHKTHLKPYHAELTSESVSQLDS